MKAEIILSVVLMSVTTGERHQRSTVLTDESKRVLEHFDFSNFDKQEALNYLDRQRHENQIRGKRSQLKVKKGSNDKEKFSDVPPKWNELRSGLANEEIHRIPASEADSPLRQAHFTPGDMNKIALARARNKRGRHSRKKHKEKISRYQSDVDEPFDDGEDDVEEYRKWKRRRKKKKKRHYWNHWSEWGPCSVTCGRGRKIRWRKCIAKNCNNGEIEMGEKTCQLPACNLLTKILGF